MIEKTAIWDALTALSQREREILFAVIETYVETGEPVGSHALAQQRADGLSAATIRNVLAGLEERGLLTHPHTSAGRVPTSAAWRAYVRQLQPAPRLLGEGETRAWRRFETELAEESDASRILLKASQFLAHLTHQVGLVAIAPPAEIGMRDIRFVRLTERRMLAVLVGSNGEILERISRLPEAFTQEQLDAAARFFTMNFRGSSLSRIRRELMRRIEEERAAYDRLLMCAVVLYHCGLSGLEASGQVYLDGAPRLAELLRNSERLAAMLEALTEKEKLLTLLNGMEEQGMDLGAGAGIRVCIGLENEALPEIALVSTSYITDDHKNGTIGILGPTRMAYGQAMNAVAMVKQVFARVLGESTGNWQ